MIVVFGVYRLNDPPILELAVRQAIDAGVRLIDTAVMYRNDERVARLIKDTPARAGTKLRRAATIQADLSRSIALFGADLERVLLHKPMPYSAYAVLEEAREAGNVSKIGVCNYSFEQLEALLAEARARGCAPPDIVQNEFHPALNTPVIELCARHGIAFEAHSTMLANEHLAPLAARAASPTSAAALAVLACKARGAHALAITTTKYEHLLEDLAAAATPHPAEKLRELLPVDALDELAALPHTHPMCKYGRQSRKEAAAAEVPHALRLAMAQAQLEKDLATYRAGGVPSDLCLAMPKIARSSTTRIPEHALAMALAASIFGDADGGLSAKTKFDGLMNRMRQKVHEHRAQTKAAKGPATCKIGPKDAVEKAEELPVDIPDGNSFEALLRTLHDARGPTSRLTTAGALTADGRLDLCKQVVRPRFGDLVDAIGVAAPGVVSHFLVGNNIIFKRLAASSSSSDGAPADGTPVDGAAPAADGEPGEPSTPRTKVVEEHLKAFEQLAASAQPIRTFYLAGNGITAASSAPIANALRHAKSLESLWLKMNPIATGAYHFGCLVATSPKLVLLDLFNTGLLDAGAAALADGLASAGGLTLAPALQHLYLNVNGLTPASLPSLLAIAAALPRLESLFVGENKLGDDATIALLDKLPARPLARLELGSNALTDVALPALGRFVARHAATLRALELSSYKSTHYFRLKPNLFGTTAAGNDELVALATAHQLQYLGLDNCLLSRAAAAALLPRLCAPPAVCTINARQRRAPTDAADAPPPTLQRLLSDVGVAPATATAATASHIPIAAAIAVGAAAALAAVAIRPRPPLAIGLGAALSAAALSAAALACAKAAKIPSDAAAPLEAVTYGAPTLVGNSMVRHTADELTAIRHPPQLPFVMSIYRNKM